ncbi:hypothetical protein EHI42_04650 [Rhizobium hidalgonense]|uniref:hypothetical protein n=1 Tax=Rhizobium hidalgonense TaxID=1538159 RepID=UPI000FEC6E03|nr:hypothetical protein [Rhizobium hidalgonense]RWX19443.1 hypothetical protein EHI42_04650 [Rhizobium hidalgonense]
MAPVDEDERSGPKVPFRGDAPAKAPKPADGPKVLFGTARAPRTLDEGPRIIGGGVARRRISCTVEDLRALDPLAAESVLRQATRAVDAVNFDDHEFDDIVRFGAHLQELHGRLAEEQLALADDERLQDARRLATDLVVRLGELDPEHLFSPGRGFLGGVRAALSRSAEAESFRERSAGVVRSARVLKERRQAFAELEDRATSLKRKLTALAAALNAHILGGMFLVRHVEEHPLPDPAAAAHHRSQKDALETRLGSLTATASSVALGERVLETMIATISGVRRFADDLVESDLPAWQTACAATLTAKSEGRPYDVSVTQGLYEKLLSTLTRRN